MPLNTGKRNVSKIGQLRISENSPTIKEQEHWQKLSQSAPLILEINQTPETNWGAFSPRKTKEHCALRYLNLAYSLPHLQAAVKISLATTGEAGGTGALSKHHSQRTVIT